MKTVQNKKVSFTRIFDAPRSLVYEAWTDPAHMAAWWGPKDFTNPVCEMDVRKGGAIRIDMQGPDGTVYPMTGTFIEVIAQERLVFHCYARPDDAGAPMFEVLNTVIFEEYEGKTKLHLNAEILKAEPQAAGAAAGMEEGWSQSLERLEDCIAVTI